MTGDCRYWLTCPWSPPWGTWSTGEYSDKYFVKYKYFAEKFVELKVFKYSQNIQQWPRTAGPGKTTCVIVCSLQHSLHHEGIVLTREGSWSRVDEGVMCQPIRDKLALTNQRSVFTWSRVNEGILFFGDGKVFGIRAKFYAVYCPVCPETTNQRLALCCINQSELSIYLSLCNTERDIKEMRIISPKYVIVVDKLINHNLFHHLHSLLRDWFHWETGLELWSWTLTLLAESQTCDSSGQTEISCCPLEIWLCYLFNN